ncbi:MULTISPECIES: phosphatase PAP2 family protein [Campylobacter]|nr:phosphatase PAP2 family protein [Campylobacter taeniopygiae]MBZ7936002.1 phosphatase PAP2 family protein [Campylobacter sp. B0100352/1]
MSVLKNKIQLFECLWLCLFGIMFLRLVFDVFFSIYTLIILGYLMASFVLLFLKNYRLKFGIYVLFMNSIFTLIKEISPLINAGKKDYYLALIDAFILGDIKNLSLFFDNFSNAYFTELLSIAYLLFMVQLLFYFIFYLCRDEKISKAFYNGILSLYAIGFLGYIFIPAIGPYFYYASEFKSSLNGFFFRDFLNKAYPNFSNFSDVFPSLHCGVSLFILLFLKHFDKKHFYFWLIPCILLWFSTIYLRYHYLIDCIVGFILAYLSYQLAKRTFNANFKIQR